MTPAFLPRGLAEAGPSSMLQALGRAAMAAAPGSIALLLEPTGVLARPSHRRAARTLLDDAARLGGGQVVETARGDLLLLGGGAAAADRAAQALAGLGAETCRWTLPQDRAALLAWGADGRLPDHPGRPLPAAAPETLVAALAATSPASLLRRASVLRLPRRGPPSLAAVRIRLSHRALAAVLGPLADDQDLARYAEHSLLERFAPGLAADPADAPLLTPAALAEHAPAPGTGGRALLSIAILAEPGRFAARRAALGRAGWGVALVVPDAAVLPLLDIPGLAADLPPDVPFLLRYAPALEARAQRLALAMLDPARLILGDCNDPAALDAARALGIERCCGRAVDALLATARQADCSPGKSCPADACRTRAAALVPTGRAGCRAPERLRSLLPLAA